MRVLITGASGGLGSAVIEQFVSEGYSVTGVARSWRSADPRFHQIAAELTIGGECLRMTNEAGDVDALVHVLGGFAGGTPLADTTEESWDQMMNLNLRSAFLVFRAVLPRMLERDRGRIIAVGSRAGVEPASGFSAYGVSKAGLVHLIRTLALELKDTGITANVVMPSTIDTDLNRAAMPKADFSKWVTPASIAKVVSWLAGDASQDVSGAVVPVYGKA
jgi:NAD(P)-dependent dehydrogenase (short-subunit alcohol dehydrogenase family)